MAFIKLTRASDGEPAYFNLALLAQINKDERGSRLFVAGEYGIGANGVCVAESPSAILAAIAEAEGAPADDETPLDEVRAHLGAALSQVGPSDDQIIVDHIRAAYALLRARRRS